LAGGRGLRVDSSRDEVRFYSPSVGWPILSLWPCVAAGIMSARTARATVRIMRAGHTDIRIIRIDTVVSKVQPGGGEGRTRVMTV